MADEILEEEFQVLESIYPTELTKISERELQIDVEPEDPVEDEEETVKLSLTIVYPDSYPEVLPELSITTLEGPLDEDDISMLIDQLKTVGEENVGMAMTFTLVSHLRERLSELARAKVEMRRKAESEKERLALEAEEARTRGTPVTVESFKTWRIRFNKEMAVKRAREEEDRLKGMSLKERDEYKKIATRLSGKQLFERNRNLVIEDASLFEEGAESVDVSQYDRSNTRDDEEEEDRLEFSDSD